jgi:demethylmenaquinone methyltransferase/2-methoxy-6-polyprenyl-1,4-benzoquinol methylase
MSISYTLISRFYGLLDIIYFRKDSNNPRLILLNKISNVDSKLLEIAVGTAKNSILLAKNKSKIKITRIDLSKEMLEIAQNNIVKERIQNIKLLNMDALDTRFENETFDFIIISLLFHEIKEEISDVILKECEKILKKDGKIYILEWDEPKKLTQKMLFLTIKIFEPKEFKSFMRKDLSNYFEKNGFKINSIEYGNYSKVIELIKSSNQ